MRLCTLVRFVSGTVLISVVSASASGNTGSSLRRPVWSIRSLPPSISSAYNGHLRLFTPLGGGSLGGVEQNRHQRLATGAVQQEETAFKEVTIYISSQYRAAVMALLAAVDKKTTITGLADFDSLSSTYGLIKIHRRNRIAPGFYGYGFRLTFSASADVAALAEAYWNVPYIRATEPKSFSAVRGQKARDEATGRRIVKKLGAGVLGGNIGTYLVLLATGLPFDSTPDLGFSAGIIGYHIRLLGWTLGAPIGVSKVDKLDRWQLTWAGSVAGWYINKKALEHGYYPWLMRYSPLIGAIVMSELWRKSPQTNQARRVALGLVLYPNGGLFAVVSLLSFW